MALNDDDEGNRDSLGTTITTRKPSFYPEEAICNALLDEASKTKKLHLDTHSAYHNYAWRPSDSRTPVVWKKLHFIFLGKVVEFPGDQWITGSNCVQFNHDHGQLEEVALERGSNYHVYDIDIEDAAGTLYPVRVVQGREGCSVYENHCGKVFDRRDTSRVLAEIQFNNYIDNSDCCATRIVATATIVANFVEHPDFAAIEQYLHRDKNLPAEGDCQFSWMVSLALYTGFKHGDDTPRVLCRNGIRLQQLMLKLLCKSEGNNCYNSNNLAAMVLTQEGFVQERLSEYSAEAYVTCADGTDRSLAWYLQDGMAELMVAYQRYQLNDDAEGAAATLKEHFVGSNGEIFRAREDAWINSDFNRVLVRRYDTDEEVSDEEDSEEDEDSLDEEAWALKETLERKKRLKKYFDRVKPLTMGWCDDKEFFAWMAERYGGLEEFADGGRKPEDDDMKDLKQGA